MVQKKDTALLAHGFAEVANNQRYWNQWLVADVWATLINQELQLPEEIKVTGAYLTQSLLRSVKYKSIKDVVDIYYTPNDYGLFRSKISKVTAFYVTTTTTCPKLNNHMPGGSTQTYYAPNHAQRTLLPVFIEIPTFEIDICHLVNPSMCYIGD
jgi:hypothetical protein